MANKMVLKDYFCTMIEIKISSNCMKMENKNEKSSVILMIELMKLINK